MSALDWSCLERFEGQPVLVIGDVMLDEYVFGDTERISPDAPVPVVRAQSRELRLGGAGNVAKNLRALGGTPMLVGVVGDDERGKTLRRAADALGIEHRLLVAIDGRPTTHKLRVIARHQHVVRLDDEQSRPLEASDEAHLLATVRALPRPALVILSDYAKGVLTPSLLRELIAQAARWSVPVLVDPKRRDFSAYRGASYLTPNAAEAATATGVDTSTHEGVLAACGQLLEATGANAILLTRGERGMALVPARTNVLAGNEPAPPRFITARRRDVFDVTGAGDTVIAAFGLALAAGLAADDAMLLANCAAGVVVGKVGAATCSRDELAREAGLTPRSPVPGAKDALLSVPGLLSGEEAAAFATRCRREGRRVVFTNGCFDLLHAGHVVLLEAARARGDALVVGLNSDASIKRLKGAGRPVQSLEDRARILGALRVVDAVVAFEEDTPLALILALQPDVLVKGGDYRVETIVGASEVYSWGGEVFIVPTVENRSTTGILARRVKGPGPRLVRHGA